MKIKKIIIEAVFKSDVAQIEKYLNNVYKRFIQTNGNSKNNAIWIIKELNKYALKLVKISGTFDKVTWILTQEKSFSAKDNNIGVVGAAYANDGELTIEVNENILYPFSSGGKIWKRFVSIVKEFISHELIHLHQFDKIYDKYKNNPKKYWEVMEKIAEVSPNDVVKYLSAPLEIMAFANQAYNEFKNKGLDDENIRRYIREWSKYVNDDYSYVFYSYASWMSKHKAFKKFLKNIYELTEDSNL